MSIIVAIHINTRKQLCVSHLVRMEEGVVALIHVHVPQDGKETCVSIVSIRSSCRQYTEHVHVYKVVYKKTFK